MLKRKIMDVLVHWKENNKKECLVLHGVRQCGKTFIIRRFAEQYYKNVIEINFVERPDMIRVFSGDLDVKTLSQGIALRMPDVKFIPGETLLFFDEIQECPAARTSLKFWAEDGRYDVIASGSLLGMTYKDTNSIPVGYEYPVDMYPLDFIEFLWALGIDQSFIEDLSLYTSGMKEIPDHIHDGMMQYLRQFLVIGGMPEVVNSYIDSHNYQSVQRVQDKILRDYLDDIAKYANNADRIKARTCYLSIPRQLSKENHKFQYSVVEKKGTARKFESSIDWLREAGMIVNSYNVSTPDFPLLAYMKEDQFRVYLSDIGLFSAMFGYQIKETILNDSLSGPAKGGLYESLIADILYKRGEKLYYYKKEDSSLEIEFLLERKGKVIPVEVKAKKGSTKSLNEMLKKDQIEIGYKLTSQNTGVSDKKITLPLYLAAFL